MPGASNPSGTASTILNAAEAAEKKGKHGVLAHGALILGGQALAGHLIGGEAGYAAGMVGNAAKVAIDAAAAGRTMAKLDKGLERMATPAEARAFNEAHQKELAHLLRTRSAARQVGSHSAHLAATLIGDRKRGGDPALVAALRRVGGPTAHQKALAAKLARGG